MFLAFGALLGASPVLMMRLRLLARLEFDVMPERSVSVVRREARHRAPQHT